MSGSQRGSVRKRQDTKQTVWRARYWDDAGRQHSRSFPTKGGAEAWLQHQISKVQRGEWTDPVGGKVTVEEWCAKWLDDRPDKRPTTLARDRSVLNSHWVKPLGHRPLASLRPADVQACVKVMGEKLAPKTVSTNYGVWRACMNAAVDAELIARTPCRGVRLPKAAAPDGRDERIRFLERAQLNQLAAAVPKDYEALIYVAGVLGLRWSECVGLRVGRIDFLKRTLTVAETIAEVDGILIPAPGKTKASHRTLAVPPFLVEMLAAHLARSGRTDPDALVFQSTEGGPLRATNWRRRVWAPAAKAAGVEGLTFHGLRHTAVGFMIALGYQAAVIQKRMGHASIRTTMDVYGHLLPSTDEAVADGLERLFSARVRQLGQ